MHLKSEGMRKLVPMLISFALYFAWNCTVKSGMEFFLNPVTSTQEKNPNLVSKYCGCTSVEKSKSGFLYS